MRLLIYFFKNFLYYEATSRGILGFHLKVFRIQFDLRDKIIKKIENKKLFAI